MLKSRPAVFALGVLLLIVAVGIWRITHPMLSDQQQIAALMEGVRSAVATRNTNRLSGYLADDFAWGGQGKPEAVSSLRGVFFQTRDLEPSFFDLKISVKDETATATGSYSLRYRMQKSKTKETQRGRFQIALEKRDGAWKVVSAQNGG